jgi:hypothetical protein
MKHTPQLHDKVQKLGRGIYLVTSSELQYLECSYRSGVASFVQTTQIDVLPGGMLEALEQAKQWQHAAKLEVERRRYRLNKESRAKSRDRAKVREAQAVVEEVTYSQIEREIRNGAVIEAARRDVANVWARYGPALEPYRYRVPAYQWI